MAAKKESTIKEGYDGVKLAKAAKGQANYETVSVNGKTYKIQRGVSVAVPLSVAEVIANSDIARNEADSFVESNMQ